MKRFTLLTLFVCLMLTNSKAQVNTQDSLALVNIYNTTNGSAWTQKWTRTQPVSTWFGVTVASGRVTGLSLPNNNLTGNLLTSTIAKFTKLKVLRLQNNQITGAVPAAIATLTDMEEVDLSSNNFSGTLPVALFNNLSKLQRFNVAGNDLGGWIPTSIGSAAALTEVNMSNNRLSGKIPAGVNNLTNLTKFLVANNQIIGPMPTGKLCSPSVEVDISGNRFTFSGVECLGSNPNARYDNQQNVALSQSGLKLSVAAGGNLVNNTYKWYTNAAFSGYPYYTSSNASIPSLDVIENGTYWVAVTNNQLPGLTLKSDSITITNVSSLRQKDSTALVDLYNSTKGAQWINKTNWLTNTPLENWYGVQILNGRVGHLLLNDNNMEGKVPNTIKYLTALRNIELVNNKLTGIVPEIYRSRQLVTIRLSNNKFYGTLPSTWGNLSQLSAIEISSNQFTGSIPESWGNLKKMILIDLSNNDISGIIPGSLATIPSFSLKLDHNNLTGPFPQVFCSNTNVGVRAEYNKLNFSGLECVAQNEAPVLYANQASVPLINQNPLLKVAAGGTVANNTYKWYKNNVLVTTKTGDSTYVMPTSGSYHAIITNSQATQLTLSSDTVFFNVTPGLLQDSLALVDIYNSITSGLDWVLTNPVSTWEGVIIQNGRVVALELGDLSGTLSPSIGNLSELTGINIGFPVGGNLTGNIPTNIANLSKLQELQINKNNLTGSIPDNLGRNQPELRLVFIVDNPLTGGIPAGLEYAGNLEDLHIRNTEIGGTIPLFFKKLSSNLDLQGNKLTGTIPDSLSAQGVPFFVNLSNNQLSGPLPQWTSGPISLDLSYNQLSGTLPENLRNWGTWIRLNNNQLTGAIPKLDGGYASEINISHNLFESVTASNCEGNAATYPETLKLNNNKLNFTGLECLTSNAGFNGIISPQASLPVVNDNAILKAVAGGTPANNTYKWYNGSTLVATKNGDSSFTYTETGSYHATVVNSAVAGITLYSDTVNITALGSLNSDSLALVDIYNNVTSGLNWVLTNPVSTWGGVHIENGRVTGLELNGLSGTLSPSIGNLNELKLFYIDYFFGGGNLTGNIPSTIANLTKLKELAIGGNNFTGPIPDDLGRNQPNLFMVAITDNPVTGNIPSGLEYSDLSEFYIINTQIEGAIPDYLKKLPLFYIALQQNKLTGSIPDTLTSNDYLGYIDLSYNQLTGSIPQSLCTVGPIGLNLSHNQLSGSIPDSLIGSWVNLSDNRLTGSIPDLRSGRISFDLQNNLLESVNPVNCGATIYYGGGTPLNLFNNKLNFTALECLASATVVGEEGFNFSPQQNIPIINQNPILKAAAGGTLANNTYKWYKGAALLATNTGDSTLTITTPGLYYCIVTNSSVPGVELHTDSVSIITVSSRKMQGVNDGAANGIYNGKLSVYPNPANTGSVYIKGLQKAESVLLYNAAGQLVKQWQNVNGNQQLNISGINNGVYMLKIVEKGNQTMLKFIKE